MTHTTGGGSRRRFLLAAGAATAGLVVRALPLGAQAPRSLKIGIIGSGRQGGSVGTLWAKAGHQVFFSSRHPEQLKELVAKAGPNARAGLPQEAAAFGDVIFVAVPYGALPQIGKELAAQMKGKIVIECGNPVERRDGPMATEAMTKGTGVASLGMCI